MEVLSLSASTSSRDRRRRGAVRASQRAAASEYQVEHHARAWMRQHEPYVLGLGPPRGQRQALVVA